MLFLKPNKHDELQAAGIFHVDDLVLAYDSEYPLSELLAAFSSGAVKYSPDSLHLCGRDLIFRDEGVEVNHKAHHRRRGEPPPQNRDARVQVVFRRVAVVVRCQPTRRGSRNEPRAEEHADSRTSRISTR